MDALIAGMVAMLAVRILGAAVLIFVRRAPAEAAPRAGAPDPCLAPLLGLPPASGPDPEASLLRQLNSGEITRRQYRNAVEELARRDAAVHPLRGPS
ncbi:hypothetical protein AB0J83_18495 [Actinoplanes sp. NPDC049596]|uniref:hypothetical protein n=1 Tax=unclassified Actinoplanes TaxID=2626549 RepID=UPI00344AFA49